ncbi:MAG: hypothetical protein WC998_00645 [Candidatus Paceibacterota bacterium]|jgi:hypothetical protein
MKRLTKSLIYRIDQVCYQVHNHDWFCGLSLDYSSYKKHKFIGAISGEAQDHTPNGHFGFFFWNKDDVCWLFYTLNNESMCQIMMRKISDILLLLNRNEWDETIDSLNLETKNALDGLLERRRDE